MRRVSPSSPCRDLLPARGEKEASRPSRPTAQSRTPSNDPAPPSRPLSPRARGEGEDEGRAPGSAYPQMARLSRAASAPHPPAGTFSPRARRRRLPDRPAQRPKAARRQTTRPHRQGPLLPASGEKVRMRGGRQVLRTRKWRDFHAPRQPLIPLPGPSPRARGEGGCHPRGALPLFLKSS